MKRTSDLDHLHMSWDFLELKFTMSTFGTTELPHNAYFTCSTLWGSPISSNDDFIRPSLWGSPIPSSQTQLIAARSLDWRGVRHIRERVATLTLRVITVSVPLQCLNEAHI